jgi:hypothetical protein
LAILLRIRKVAGSKPCPGTVYLRWDFLYFSCLSRQMSELYVKLRHDYILTYPFQFINYPIIRCSIAWATNNVVK